MPRRDAFCRKHLEDAVRGIAWTARLLERSCETLTLAQYRVLALIASAPERAAALAERAAVTRPTLTSLIDSLVQRGYVQRSEVSGDRRGVLLELTRAGGRALAEAEDEMIRRMEFVLERANDPKALARSLSDLRAALESVSREVAAPESEAAQ